MCLAPAAAMATEEELQEADELCPSYYSPDDGCDQRWQQPHHWFGRKPCPRMDDDAASGGSNVRGPVGSSVVAAPMPIVVPITVVTTKKDYEDCDDDGAAFVPPHVVLEARRRWSERRAALSMCEGHGHTLKGGDLQSVRTVVLHMTGFIET